MIRQEDIERLQGRLELLYKTCRDIAAEIEAVEVREDPILVNQMVARMDLDEVRSEILAAAYRVHGAQIAAIKAKGRYILNTRGATP